MKESIEYILNFEDWILNFFFSISFVLYSFIILGGTHKRQTLNPPTPYPPVSISTHNHNRQSQR